MVKFSFVNIDIIEQKIKVEIFSQEKNIHGRSFERFKINK